MAHTTLTLTASGRLNTANLGGAPTASTDIVISSGVIGLIPYKTSITCNLISCLGTSSNQGAIGVPAGANYSSFIKTKGVSSPRFVSVDNIERINSGTLSLKGGGAF